MEANHSQSDIVETKWRARWWLQCVFITFAATCLTELLSFAHCASTFVDYFVSDDAFRELRVILIRNLPLLGWGWVLWAALRHRRGVRPAFGALVGGSLAAMAFTARSSVELLTNCVELEPFEATPVVSGLLFILGGLGIILGGLVGGLAGGLAAR